MCRREAKLFLEKWLTGRDRRVTLYPIQTASSLFRPRRFAPANGGVFLPNKLFTRDLGSEPLLDRCKRPSRDTWTGYNERGLMRCVCKRPCRIQALRRIKESPMLSPECLG